MVKKSKVDPDTGYTPEQQKAKMAEWTGEKQPKKKLHRNPMSEAKSEVDLKAQAVALYEQGKGPKDVAKELSISYASAYYYKRFVGAEVAKARLQESMKRV